MGRDPADCGADGRADHAAHRTCDGRSDRGPRHTSRRRTERGSSRYLRMSLLRIGRLGGICGRYPLHVFLDGHTLQGSQRSGRRQSSPGRRASGTDRSVARSSRPPAVSTLLPLSIEQTMESVRPFGGRVRCRTPCARSSVCWSSLQLVVAEGAAALARERSGYRRAWA